jgi:hypothetical protein
MKWPVKQPANVGDTRNRKVFAWLPTICNHWDKTSALNHSYHVWLEHYKITEEYKEDWVVISRGVIE